MCFEFALVIEYIAQALVAPSYPQFSACLVNPAIFYKVCSGFHAEDFVFQSGPAGTFRETTQNVVDFHSLQEQVDEVLPPAGTDSRTRATIEKDSPSFGRFTELDGWSKILWKCLSLISNTR